jgi:hypothetical protein
VGVLVGHAYSANDHFCPVCTAGVMLVVAAPKHRLRDADVLPFDSSIQFIVRLLQSVMDPSDNHNSLGNLVPVTQWIRAAAGCVT